MKPFSKLVAVAAMGMFLGGCLGVTAYYKPTNKPKASPPAHAKAHGLRRQYRYYPGAEVYFDLSRRVYFFYSGGSWQVNASLPSSLKVKLGSAVSIEMDSDKPYLHNRDHRKKYPPGQLKNKGKGKKKGNKWK